MTSPLLAMFLACIYFYTMVDGFRGGVRLTPNTAIEIEGAPVEPLEGGNFPIEEIVIQSIRLSRRNATGESDQTGDTDTTNTGSDDTDQQNSIFSSELDSDGKYVGVHSRDCSAAVLLTPMRTGKIIGADPVFLDRGSIVCHWELVGAGDCVPMITCPNFTLAEPIPTEDDPCLEEYLEITDGSYGYKKYCGTFGPMKVSSGRDYRDLYVTLAVGDPEKIGNRQVGCVVTCANLEEDELTPLAETSEPELNSSCSCGRKPTPVHENRSAESDEFSARRGEFPWVVALVAAGTRNPFCVGSIINDRFILTAAHCFRGVYTNIANIEVIIHPHELNVSSSVTRMHGVDLWDPDELKKTDDDDRSYRHTISRYFVHPLFVKQTNDFDVALVKLALPIDFQLMKMLSPVCLPDSGQWDQTREGVNAVDVGWGLKSQADPVDTGVISSLKKQVIEVFHNPDCHEAYDWRFSHRMLCAGHREEETFCLGDSGSPLIAEKTKMIWEQIGILAYAEGCLSKSGPGLFTDMRQVVQWVRYISSMEEAIWCSG